MAKEEIRDPFTSHFRRTNILLHLDSSSFHAEMTGKKGGLFVSVQTT